MNAQANASEARAAEFFAYVEPPVLTEKERKLQALATRARVLCEFFEEKLTAINAEMAALRGQQ